MAPPETPEAPPEPAASLKIRSQDVTEWPRRAAARAMLRAVGMTDGDFGLPQVGIASTWNEVTPCNLPLKRLAQRRRSLLTIRRAGSAARTHPARRARGNK